MAARQQEATNGWENDVDVRVRHDDWDERVWDQQDTHPKFCNVFPLLTSARVQISGGDFGPSLVTVSPSSGQLALQGRQWGSFYNQIMEYLAKENDWISCESMLDATAADRMERSEIGTNL